MDPMAMSMGGPQPAAAPGSEATGSFSISPSFSPIHPPSAQHNLRILSSLSTLTSIFSGSLAGILGLRNLYGFALYFFASLFNAAIVWVVKGKGKGVERFLPARNADPTKEKGAATALDGMRTAWDLMGVGQESVLTFLLFWIGLYAIIHVYD